jgi:hypothetical protein
MAVQYTGSYPISSQSGLGHFLWHALSMAPATGELHVPAVCTVPSTPYVRVICGDLYTVGPSFQAKQPGKHLPCPPGLLPRAEIDV